MMITDDQKDLAFEIRKELGSVDICIFNGYLPQPIMDLMEDRVLDWILSEVRLLQMKYTNAKCKTKAVVSAMATKLEAREQARYEWEKMFQSAHKRARDWQKRFQKSQVRGVELETTIKDQRSLLKSKDGELRFYREALLKGYGGKKLPLLLRIKLWWNKWKAKITI